VDTCTCCGFASRVLERNRHTIMVSQRHAMRALAVLSAVAAISMVSAAKPEMKRRSTELPHATHLLQPVKSLGSGGCTVVPNVDRHLLRNGMDVSLRPLLGWTISPGCGPGAQTGALQECSLSSLLSHCMFLWVNRSGRRMAHPTLSCDVTTTRPRGRLFPLSTSARAHVP
jgi:hypothetical protein